MLVSVQTALLLLCGALLVALVSRPPHYPSYASQCGDSSMWKCLLPAASVIASTHADCCFCHGFYCNEQLFVPWWSDVALNYECQLRHDYPDKTD